MQTDPDVTRIVRSWLLDEEHESADRVLALVLTEVDTTRQRRSWWPAWRIADMNTYAKLAIAAAAVVVVAVVGINLLPASGGVAGGPAATPSPTPTPSATPLPSPSPTPGADVWPPSTSEAGTYDVTVNGIPFSFTLPSNEWRTTPVGPGGIEKGSYPNDDYAWIGFMGPENVVATDPCAGLTAPVHTVADAASARTTIRGTHAAGPADVTVGGRPAKLVVLTIDHDIPCATTEFWLYGQFSAYPNTLDSTIKDWIFGVNGTPYGIHSDQAGPNPELEREIQQIVDSIQFE